MRLIFLTLFLCLFSVSSHAEEQFKGLAGVLLGMSHNEVVNVNTSKGWTTYDTYSNEGRMDGINEDNVRVLVTNGIEIAGGRWKLYYIFFDPLKRSESKTPSASAKVIGFKLKMNKDGESIWVDEKYGSRVTSNVVDILTNKYGLSIQEVNSVTEETDKEAIVKGKMGKLEVSFKKREGNKMFNMVNRTANKDGGNEPIHWIYEVMIYEDVGVAKTSDL